MSALDILAYKRDVAPNMLLIFGKEKAGKSTALASVIHEQVGDVILEKDSKMHIIDVGHGMESFINKWVEKGKPLSEETDAKGQRRILIPNVDIVTVDNKEEFHEAVWTLPDGYKYYVIDDFTRAGKHFIKAVQPKATPGTRAKDANIDIAALFEDYIDRMEELAWQLNRKGAWLIITCHEKHIPDSKKVSEQIVPLLYGSAASKLARVVTGYWRLQVVDVQDPNKGWVTGRQFRTAQTEVIMAGDRTGALDPVEPANIARCIKKIVDARATGIVAREVKA